MSAPGAGPSYEVAGSHEAVASSEVATPDEAVAPRARSLATLGGKAGGGAFVAHDLFERDPAGVAAHTPYRIGDEVHAVGRDLYDTHDVTRSVLVLASDLRGRHPGASA